MVSEATTKFRLDGSQQHWKKQNDILDVASKLNKCFCLLSKCFMNDRIDACTYLLDVTKVATSLDYSSLDKNESLSINCHAWVNWSQPLYI